MWVLLIDSKPRLNNKMDFSSPESPESPESGLERFFQSSGKFKVALTDTSVKLRKLLN